MQRHSVLEQIRHVKVPKAVKGSRRQSCLTSLLRKGVTEHDRMQRLPLRHGADQVNLAEPKAKPDGGLLLFVLSEFDEKASRQFDGALAALGLQGRHTDFVADPADSLCDMQLAGVHILPSQAANFAAP